MNGMVRRRIEMGFRALQFSHDNPDPKPSYEVMVKRLEHWIREADEQHHRQMKGLLQVAAAAEHKRRLRRTMKVAHLAYLAHLAEAASREEPELHQKFAMPRHESRAYQVFRAAAGGVATHAAEWKELLERYGLSAEALEALEAMLADFDRATGELLEGRLMHVGATAGLKRASIEILQAVAVLNGFNQIRFAGDRSALVAWASASKVLAHSPRGDGDAAATGPAEEGDVRPAA